MFLQTGMTNRRKFLERSMLGFGGAFLLPSLLTSCTDHRITPDNPFIFPPVGDNDIDWNDDAKITISTLLGLVPEGGEILSALVDIFWPSSGGDVWGQIKDQVEALVDQKINDLVDKTVSDDLTGLKNVLDNYHLALYPTDVNGNPLPVDYERVRTYWRAADDFLGYALPHFQSQGYEVLLLPLFAQFANIYLATYRDAVAFGKSWGFLDSEVTNAATKLTNGITNFTTYTTNTYTVGLSNLQKTTQIDYYNNEPFKTTNRFNRQMTLWVLDFMDTWPYYDATLYPNGAKNPDGTAINLFTREIYSDPYGSVYDTDQPIGVLFPVTQFPTLISVWTGNRVDAVQLTYPAGGGPRGLTQTPRFGDQNGGINQQPHGGVYTISPDNLFIQAEVTYEDTDNKYPGHEYAPQAINTIQFTYADGAYTPRMGGDVGHYKSGVIGYLYMAVSSVYIHGVNYTFKNSADCIVFGFMYWNPPAATLRAIGRIYITSPKERSVADFAKAFPKLGLSANSISDGLKAARKAYWEYKKKHVK